MQRFIETLNQKLMWQLWECNSPVLLISFKKQTKIKNHSKLMWHLWERNSLLSLNICFKKKKLMWQQWESNCIMLQIIFKHQPETAFPYIFDVEPRWKILNLTAEMDRETGNSSMISFSEHGSCDRRSWLCTFPFSSQWGPPILGLQFNNGFHQS